MLLLPILESIAVSSLVQRTNEVEVGTHTYMHIPISSCMLTRPPNYFNHLLHFQKAKVTRCAALRLLLSNGKARHIPRLASIAKAIFKKLKMLRPERPGPDKYLTSKCIPAK
jgi:hypothetical protein